ELIGRESAALHQHANEEDAEHEQVRRRRDERGSASDAETADQQNREKEQRQRNRFAGGRHFLVPNRRIGLRSDASRRMPASSSDLTSSGVCIPRLASSTSSRPSGARAIARSIA